MTMDKCILRESTFKLWLAWPEMLFIDAGLKEEEEEEEDQSKIIINGANIQL